LVKNESPPTSKKDPKKGDPSEKARAKKEKKKGEPWSGSGGFFLEKKNPAPGWSKVEKQEQNENARGFQKQWKNQKGGWRAKNQVGCPKSTQPGNKGGVEKKKTGVHWGAKRGKTTKNKWKND